MDRFESYSAMEPTLLSQDHSKTEKKKKTFCGSLAATSAEDSGCVVETKSSVMGIGM